MITQVIHHKKLLPYVQINMINILDIINSDPNVSKEVIVSHLNKINPSSYPLLLDKLEPDQTPKRIADIIFGIICSNENFLANCLKTNEFFTMETGSYQGNFFYDGTIKYVITCHDLILGNSKSVEFIKKAYEEITDLSDLSYSLCFSLFENKNLGVNEMIEVIEMLRGKKYTALGDAIGQKQIINFLMSRDCFWSTNSEVNLDINLIVNKVRIISTIIHLFGNTIRDKYLDVLLETFFEEARKTDEKNFVSVEEDLIFLFEQFVYLQYKNFNRAESDDPSYLHYACEYDMNKLIKYLVSKGAKINLGNSFGNPFKVAIKNSSFETVTNLYELVLLEEPAVGEKPFEIKESYLRLAKENEDERVYEWIKKEFENRALKNDK